MTPTRWRSKPPAPTPSETGSATGSRFATAPCRPRRGSATRSCSPTSSPRCLVELAPRLAAHLEPGGVLVASGIVTDRADEVIAALEAAGLTVRERRDDGEWVALRLEAPR